MVLGFSRQAYKNGANRIEYPKISAQAEKYAVVTWLTSANKLSPIQLVAGYLPTDWIN